MATLYVSQDTAAGLVGIMADSQWDLFKRLDEELLAKNDQHWPTPIFNFSDEDLPGLTGSLTMAEKLLEGHQVVRVRFWVPYSDFHKDPSGTRKLFSTTRQQVIDVFGVDPETLN